MSKQEKYFVDSFVKNGEKFISTSDDDKVEPVTHPRHKSLQHPIWHYVAKRSNEGTVALGSKVRYKFPRNGLCKAVFIHNVFAQTGTASYEDYIAMLAIDKVELKHGSSRIIADYDYKTVMMKEFADMEPEAVAHVLSAAGGASITSTGGTYPATAWIPLFFDSLNNPKKPGLNLADLDSPELELVITYRASTDCIASGATGAAISSSEAQFYMSDTTENVSSDDYVIPGIYYDTIKDQTIATSTETSVDVSEFTRYNKKLYLFSQPTAQTGTANKQFYALSQYDSVKTVIDTQEEIFFEHKRISPLEFVLFNKAVGYSSTFTNPPIIIPFGDYSDHLEEEDNAGGFSADEANTFKLKLTHSVGANENLCICSVSNALYAVRNGQLYHIS